MSPKRQPSKQRRQAQNQRQRAALQNRRENAAAAGAVPSGTTSEGGSTGSGGGGGGGSLFSRLRGSAATGRAVRTGTPVSDQPVGYRAALSALLAAVAGAAVGALLISVPVNADGEVVNSAGAMAGEWTLSAAATLEDNAEATPEELADAVEDWTPNGKEPYAKASFPLSVFLILPVVGAALAFRAITKRSPAKVVNRAMYVTLFGTLLSGQPIIFLPTVVGIGIAAFQVRKAEVQAAQEEGGDAGAPTGGGVIDVDEVAEERAEEEELEADELAEDDSFLEAEDVASEFASDPAPPSSTLGRLRRSPNRE